MRSFALTLSVFLLIIVPAHSQCTREVDEFTGNETISCPRAEVPVEEQPRNNLYGAWATVVRSEGKTGIIVSTLSDSWNFLSTGKAHALIDGTRHELALASGERAVESGSVIEQNVIVLPSGKAKAAADASSFRVKIGQAVLDLSPITSDIESILEMK